MAMFKTILGLGSIILGGAIIRDAIREKERKESEIVDVVYDFDEYYDIPGERCFDSDK